MATSSRTRSGSLFPISSRGVVVHEPGQQEQHGQMRRPWLLPDLRAELMTVHAGHSNVQQDQVGKSLSDFLEGIGGPFSLGDGKARLPQRATDGIAHRGVVADIENAARISDWIHNMTSCLMGRTQLSLFNSRRGCNVPRTSMTRSNSADRQEE